jgi:hypothetical protein
MSPRAGAHVAAGVSASASGADDFGDSLHTCALAHVAEAYATETVWRVPAPPRRATATGGAETAISEEEYDGDCD